MRIIIYKVRDRGHYLVSHAYLQLAKANRYYEIFHEN